MGRTHKISLLTALYLAQGLPYGFFPLALPILLRDAGYSLKAISTTGPLYLPWALKFLWAPYLDHFGTRKQWLLLQLSSVVGVVQLTNRTLTHPVSCSSAGCIARRRPTRTWSVDRC